MTDYVQSTDFSAKDSLTTGDPNKIIYGADIDAELALVSTAIASKLDGSSGTLTYLDPADKFFVYDTSAGATKVISVDNTLYLPSSATTTTGANSFSITGINPNAKRITVILNGISASIITEIVTLQISSGAVYDGTGYAGSTWDTNSGNVTYSGSSFEIIPYIATAGQTFVGTWVLTRLETSTHTWICSGSVSSTTATTYTAITNGKKTLSAVLDRLRISTSISNFDAGSFNILVEI